MNTFSLKVIASDKVFFDGKCGIIIVPALDGEQAIMSHHEDMVIATKEGEVRFKEKEDDDWTKAVVGVGCVYISHNRVIMLVDTAEKKSLENLKDFGGQRAAASEAEHSGVPCIPGIHGESYAAPEGSRKIRDQLEIK
jgi:F0F1-type ATP synthase epsilon subunit